MSEDCICPMCKGCKLEFNDWGGGAFAGSYLFPSKKDEDPVLKECSTCKGTGRVIYDKGRMIPGKTPKTLPCLEVAIEALVAHGVSIVVGHAPTTAIVEDEKETSEPEAQEPEMTLEELKKKRDKLLGKLLADNIISEQVERHNLADAIDRRRLDAKKTMPSGRKVPSNSNRLKVKVGDEIGKRTIIEEPYLDTSKPGRPGTIKVKTQCQCGKIQDVEVRALLDGLADQCKSCAKKEYHAKKRGRRDTLLKAQVQEIYNRALSGKELQREIASDFGIGISTVSNIKNRKIYKHITEPITS